MAPGAGRFVRDNVFLVAAVLLPVVVVGFFLLASAIPRWTVPGPAYDLVLRAGSYDQPVPRVAVDFAVRDGRIEARVRTLPANGYAERPSLWLFDHRTLNVRQVPTDLPDTLAPGESSRTVVVEALAGRRAMAQMKAPDGYEFQTRTQNSPGLIGDLFGMHRYGQNVAVVNRGRVIPIRMPSPYEYQPAVVAIGWLVDQGAR